MANLIKLLSIGSDPEFLIINSETGEYVSSLDIIPGTKERPIRLKALGKGFTIQKDNVLAELCVPPVNSGDELYDNIMKGVEYINNSILSAPLKLEMITGAYYSEEQLNNKYALTFGCSPSLNAWTYSQQIPDNTLGNYRGAGFHIHVGYENPDDETSVQLVRAFDLFSVVPTVLYDPDTTRRNQYGKAGEFRICTYGLELRQLGAYTMSDKVLFDAAIQGLYQAIDFVNSGKQFSDEDSIKIQACINTHNIELAEELIEQFEFQELVQKLSVLV